MSYQFPKTKHVDMPYSVTDQIQHVISEIHEIIDAKEPNHLIEECWDAIHSLETLIRKVVKHQHNMGNFINPHSIMLDVIKKNLERGYYDQSP